MRRYRLSAISYPSIAAAAIICATVPLSVSAQGFDRSRPPIVAAPPAFTMPTVQTSRLPNGLTIQLVEMHELPLVEVDVMIRNAGARMDGELAGLATFTAGMLDEGAGTRDALGIASEVAYLGAVLGTGADWDNSEVELSAPRRTLPQALDLLADIVLRPQFKGSEVQKQRDLRMANILSSRDEPNAVNNVVLNALVFPEGHPFHRPAGGDSGSTARLDSTAVRGYYTRAYTPERTTIVVTGDITMAEARQLLTARFGSWAAAGMPQDPPAAAALPAPVDRSTTIFLVDKPGAAQSVISLARPGIERSSPDYYAVQVMNTILGGSFSSRLNTNLRETRGWTYGAGSGFAYRPVPGPFRASASVRTDVTDSSLAEFKREMELIRDSLVTPQELARAQAYLALGLPADFETTGQMADQVGELLRFGLPFTYWNGYVQNVMKVTVQDVQRVARKYLDTSKMTIVIVGDLPKIRAGIDSTRIGPVQVVDVEGRPVQ